MSNAIRFLELVPVAVALVCIASSVSALSSFRFYIPLERDDDNVGISPRHVCSAASPRSLELKN